MLWDFTAMGGSRSTIKPIGVAVIAKHRDSRLSSPVTGHIPYSRLTWMARTSNCLPPHVTSPPYSRLAQRLTPTRAARIPDSARFDHTFKLLTPTRSDKGPNTIDPSTSHVPFARRARLLHPTRTARMLHEVCLNVLSVFLRPGQPHWLSPWCRRPKTRLGRHFTSYVSSAQAGPTLADSNRYLEGVPTWRAFQL
jgi:hypothetical protein